MTDRILEKVRFRPFKECMSFSVSLSAYSIPVQMNTFIQKFKKNCLNTKCIILRNKRNSLNLQKIT